MNSDEREILHFMVQNPLKLRIENLIKRGRYTTKSEAIRDLVMRGCDVVEAELKTGGCMT